MLPRLSLLAVFTCAMLEVMACDYSLSNVEHLTIAKGLKVKKTLGPDGIPSIVLRAAILEFANMFRIRTVLQKRLADSYIPAIWKIQKLISLQDTLGKLEQIIVNKLVRFTKREVDVIRIVVANVEKASQ